MELDETEFEKNTADRGGAIYAYQTIINGNGVKFEKNIGADGGAVHATRSLSTYTAIPVI